MAEAIQISTYYLPANQELIYSIGAEFSQQMGLFIENT